MREAKLDTGTKPIRSDSEAGTLHVESLLDVLVKDNGNGELSNRGKFRALPVDDKIMRRIKDVSFSLSMRGPGSK